MAFSLADATLTVKGIGTRPEPNSLSIPTLERSTDQPWPALAAAPDASKAGSCSTRRSRLMTVEGSVSCACRKNPCAPKWSGSYLIIHLNLCLCIPASPCPPLHPLPRPCFFPRPCVRDPRSFFVRRGISGGLLDDHPFEQ